MLQNLQIEFAESIFSDSIPKDFVSPNSNLTIYLNNIISNLVQTLQATYPLVLRLVGDDFFNMAAKEYINRYPSCSGNLQEYGEYFADFLLEYEPVKHLVYLNEVAKFEWICHTLCYAANASPFDISRLQNVLIHEYEHLNLILHPASYLMKFNYPILRIIDLCKNKNDETININEGGVCLLIIRREQDITLEPVTQGDFIFLTSLQQHKTLAESLKLTLEVEPQFKLDEKLTQWISNKVIVDFSLLF